MQMPRCNAATPVLLQTTVSWDRDSLVCVQKGDKEGRGWTHWLEGDKLHLVRIYNWSEKKGEKEAKSDAHSLQKAFPNKLCSV